MQTGPRIYNLFPLLAGDVTAWRAHLPRIAALGFDWVYVNPFHLPGFSGSLYAVKDHAALNPLFGDTAQADALLRGFVEDARGHGLTVMMDLVVSHTSKDSLLAAEHPDWFLHDAEGKLQSPRAVDPEAPEGFTEWGDLAQLDFSNMAARAGQVAFFVAIARHHAELGFAGFRADAAYQVPAEVWAAIIAAVPHAVFAAETLGCTPDQAAAVGRAGFAYLFNSAKWWDFQADWFFEQYDQLRAVAPSIAFPESHDTPRLAADCPEGADARAHALRHAAFAVFASAGWMMPMGFEYGFRRRLNVVTTRPEDWETPQFDLSPEIVRLNALKARLAALNQEGRLERLSPPDAPVLVLRRWDAEERSAVVLTLARDGGEAVADLGGGHEDLFAAPGVKLLVWTSASGLPRTVSQPIVIEDMRPRVDDGRFAVKREVGDMVEVSADIFKDGLDRLGARVLFREAQTSHWDASPLTALGDDRWGGRFRVIHNTRVVFTIEAWIDAFETWREGLVKKRQAHQDVGLDLTEGRQLVAAALPRAADAEDRRRLERVLADFDVAASDDERAALLLSTMLRQVMGFYPDRSAAVRADRHHEVVVDRVAARFAAWYEMFPRSQGRLVGRSASFKDCEARLPEIAGMGFDVVYLPPIHPIGRVYRKGPDNTLVAGPADPGSPYAIGSTEGGHCAVHPELGTLDDFRAFVARAQALGMEVALDLALQCAPDHPWVRDHPQWFRFRPDGSIRHAENPPKVYQDIVNLDFHSADARALWDAVLDVVLFWVGQGVNIFRIDNPHTKPVPFWEWLIATVQRTHPQVLFLAEAFTRPKMMRMLGKAGFSQSYTYFTWRNFKGELTAYLTELTRSDMRDYFRPHFFTNTPDILPGYLQSGGRAAFRIRLVLAATLGSLYGIYNGFELCEAAAVPDSEDYLHSEKYQYKVWDWNRAGHIKDDITRLNAIRRANPALHEFENLTFHQADNDSVLFYGKSTLDRSNLLFIAVTLDPFDVVEADLHFPLDDMGVPEGETFEVEDLLSGARHLWRGAVHRLRLDPHLCPAAIFRVTVWRSVSWREPCL